MSARFTELDPQPTDEVAHMIAIAVQHHMTAPGPDRPHLDPLPDNVTGLQY